MTYRSAKTGSYVTRAYAEANPDTTVKEYDRPSAARMVRAYEEAIAAAKHNYVTGRGFQAVGYRQAIKFIEDSVKEACGE